MEATNQGEYSWVKDMYKNRALKYEDSWHPDYTIRFMGLVDLKIGDRVLDLCCGTGLDAFAAAEKVGDAGEVIGVDITEGMLEQANIRKQNDTKLGPRIRLFMHDVTDLTSLPEVEKESFDFIICSNAFVLFNDPVKVVAHWREYLKVGGRLAIDITHERNFLSGIILKRAIDRMNIPFSANRLWIQSEDSFRVILEKGGFLVETVTSLDKIPGKRDTYYRLDQADEQFDFVINSDLSSVCLEESARISARPFFKEEWEKAAVDGKLVMVDSMYVYIARKL
jgi:ubiquinone/menaquinone biosynthesis C-methylase UbiE